MKTLKQHEEARNGLVKNAREERLKKVRAILDVLDNKLKIPVYTGGKGDQTDYAAQREKRRNELVHAAGEWVDLACDHCGVELYNFEPSIMLPSVPPKQRVDCVGCGFIGFVTL